MLTGFCRYLNKNFMDKLSVVIITKNEAANIEKCLRSVKDIADEIVIVDSYSTDNTLDICASYGARIFQREWDDFSSQKNFGNEKAEYEYVFSIDADEELTKEMSDSIIKLKASGLSDGIAYEVKRLTYYCGKPIRHCGWYPDKKIRLWKKSECKWEGLVHEQLVFKNEVHVKILAGDMNHYTVTDMSQQIQKILTYTNYRIEKQLTDGNLKKPWIFKILAKPMLKFFDMYFLKLGFLDGFPGLVVSVNSSMSRFWYLAKLRMILNK